MLLDYLWQGALGAWSLVLSWLHLARRDEIKDMKDRIDRAHAAAGAATADAAGVAKALDAHRLYAAETFARKAEVKDALAELKDALVTTEERLTEGHERLSAKLDDLRDRLPPKAH